MSLLQILRTSFLLFTTIVGIYCSIKIVRKKKDLINYLMASFTFLVGFYTFTVIIYDFVNELVYILIPVGILALVLSTIFVYFSFQCITESHLWFKDKLHWIPFLILWVIYAIYLPLSHPVHIISTEDVINTQVEILPLLFGIVIIASLLTFTLIKIIRTSKSFETKNNRIRMFMYSVGINLLAVVVSIISQLILDEGYLDLFFYLLLAISSLFMLRSF